MPSELRLNLLGGVTISLDERTITPFRSRSAEALLVYLALHKKTFPRQVLADFFWDDRSQKQGLSNLRTVLAMLRRQLPHHLQITRQTVAFNHDAPHCIDAAAFQQSLIASPQSPISTLPSTLALYRGDFLAGFSLPHSQGFESWTFFMREQLRQSAAAALQRLTAHLQEQGDYEDALRHARHLLQLNPLDDLAQRRLMELLWRSGQRNAALQQYASARRLLNQELGVEPDPATTALYERLRAAPFPPPGNVPAPLTSFVGREEQLAHLAALLRDPQARLITILGPGGMGKTRLLLEAARQAAAPPGRFIDGVYFIPLAHLPAGDFLPTTLAQQLSLAFHGSKEPFEQLIDYLRPREMLLALDNVEHLLTPRSRRWLARIAGDAPGVRLLISSRARLALQGERLLQLEGLDAPSAARLFTARAAAVQPDFSPDGAGAAAIERLCCLVGGMPLALELAAAGVRHLSCSEIVAQVQARLDWQFDQFPDRPRRHQNLHAVFAHSWNLLSAAEQDVARRLSIFAGPFDAAGAHKVAGAAPAQLAALLDQSLLAQEQPGWYDLHPLVRRFLAEKLQAAPTVARETARRHVDYIVRLRNIAGGDSNMESRYHALQQIMARQHDQVVAAALWLAHRRDFTGRQLVSLVETLIFYYRQSAQFESGKVTFAQLLQALAQGQGQDDNAAWLSAVLRSRLAEADLDRHAYPQAQAQFEQLLPQAYGLENGAFISFCHHKLGLLACRRADFSAAFEHLAAALPPLEDPPYPPHYFFPVYRTLTEVALVARDLQQAHAAAEKAYALALEVDSQLEAAPVYAWALGEVARLQGHLPQAREHLQHAARLARDKGYWYDVVRADIALAAVLAALGDGAPAATLAARAYDAAVKHHDRRLMALAARAQGHAAAALPAAATAQSFYRHSLTLLAEIGDEAERAHTQTHLDRLSR